MTRERAAAGPDESLREELERRFRTRTTTVRVGSGEIALLHPADPESLISEEEFERDERLPYWADVWPSSIVLARFVTSLPGPGRTLLELGSGAGLVATSAALAGFDVTVSDYYEDSLRFSRENVRHHTGREPRAMLLDWRAMPAELPRYDVVLGSDVLYERPYGALVAEAFARTLAPDGAGYVTDPGRIAVKDFLDATTQRGLHVRTLDRIAHQAEGGGKQTIDIYQIRWAGKNPS